MISEDAQAMAYDRSLALQTKIEKMIDRAKYHGEYKEVLPVLEDLKIDVDGVVDAQEEF